jgi:Cu(I)/Ag(I) efflux system membrane protein CusA/SilA
MILTFPFQRTCHQKTVLPKICFRLKLMTVCVVLASLIPILSETGVGSDVMKPIAALIVGGMITSTIHVLILVPVFFALMKERALRRGTLQPKESHAEG